MTLDGSGSTFAAVNGVTANAGTFNLLNGRGFTVSGGTLTNTGTIQVGAASTLTGNLSVNGNGTLTGGGAVTGDVLFTGTGNACAQAGATPAT